MYGRNALMYTNLFQEFFHSDGIIASAFTADALNLLHIPATASSLDVLEVDFGLGAVGQNCAET